MPCNFYSTCYSSLHVREAEVKVTEMQQAALSLVASAAAVAVRPTGPGSGPGPTRLLRSLCPLTPVSPHSAHTTVLIRLIGLDLELTPVPVAPAAVTCGPC